MKEQHRNEMRAQLRTVSRFIDTVEAQLAPPNDITDDTEVELATDVEYAISRLKAVSIFLRTRQRDREGYEEEEEGPDHEGDEWKRPT